MPETELQFGHPLPSKAKFRRFGHRLSCQLQRGFQGNFRDGPRLLIIGQRKKLSGKLRIRDRRTRLPFNRGNELANRAGQTLRTPGPFSVGQGRKRSFSFLDLTDREQQSSMINALAVRGGLPCSRVFCQCNQQIACTVCVERFLENHLFVLHERQIAQVKHGGVVKAPLQK